MKYPERIRADPDKWLDIVFFSIMAIAYLAVIIMAYFAGVFE